MGVSDLEFPHEVMRAFQDMLGAVLRIERQCKSGQYRIEVEREHAIKSVQSDLIEIVGRFVKHVISRMTVSEKTAHQNVEFIAIALIDERFICLDWDMSTHWSEFPLEAELFGTRNAGTEFFNRIDALNPEKTVDQVYALLYYLALSLGFAGKYDNQTDKSLLVQYQKKLLLILEKSFDLTMMSHHASSQDFAVLSASGNRSFLPTARKYNIAAIASIFVMFAIAQGYWYFKSSDLVRTAQAIIELGY